MNNRQKTVTTMVLRNKALNRGFSLIEMMVVLLIISIILAATAPIAAKKMARDMASGASAWIYTNNKGDVGYNVSGKNISAMIGTTKITNLPNGIKAPRLVLAGDTENPAFVFANRSGQYAGQINMTENQVTMNGGTGAVGANSVAIGMGQAHNGSEGTVAIGQGADVVGVDRSRPWGVFRNDNNIAIGYESKSGSQGATAVGPRTRAYGVHSVSIGNNAWANTNTNGTDIQGSNDNGIAIGNNTRAQGNSSIAIGLDARTEGPASRRDWINENSIAIGADAITRSNGAIALGPVTKAFGIHSIAIGIGARANSNDDGIENNGNDNGIAIGNGSRANANNCVAIGLGAVNNTANSILLGRTEESSRSTVIIPGDLQVWGNITGNIPGASASADALAGQSTRITNLETKINEIDNMLDYYSRRIGALEDHNTSFRSDKRLKNIGKKYSSGLEAIKKLDIYNYTFKNDKAKTPQVGVIAQDLEKVFPTAVTKDVYGYLRIRWDEMFYAVINAIKELDTRIIELSKNVQSYFDETKALKATVAEQQKTIDELKQEIKIQNAEFEKRLAKLEKKK